MLESLRNKRGFTLIELIIVVVILGVLILIVVAATRGDKDKANDANKKATAARLQSALEDCYGDNANSYPAALAGNACVEGKFDNDTLPDMTGITYTQTGGGTGYTIVSDLVKEGDQTLESKQ